VILAGAKHIEDDYISKLENNLPIIEWNNIQQASVDFLGNMIVGEGIELDITCIDPAYPMKNSYQGTVNKINFIDKAYDISQIDEYLNKDAHNIFISFGVYCGELIEIYNNVLCTFISFGCLWSKGFPLKCIRQCLTLNEPLMITPILPYNEDNIVNSFKFVKYYNEALANNEIDQNEYDEIMQYAYTIKELLQFTNDIRDKEIRDRIGAALKIIYSKNKNYVLSFSTPKCKKTNQVNQVIHTFTINFKNLLLQPIIDYNPREINYYDKQLLCHMLYGCDMYYYSS